MQSGVPPAQTVVQLPQWFGSVWKLTQEQPPPPVAQVFGAAGLPKQEQFPPFPSQVIVAVIAVNCWPAQTSEVTPVEMLVS
jgi:hypothetical protein